MKKILLTALIVGITLGLKAQNWNTTGDNITTGNLTIGSTTANSYSKLVIKGANQPLYIDSKRDLSFEFSAAGSAIIRAYRGGSWDTYMQFLTTPNTGGSPLTRMHINGDGNIGIGTTTPSSKLFIKQSIDNSNGGLTIADNAGGRLIQIYGEGSAGRQVIKTVTSNPLVFDLNGSEKLRFNSNGNVGIGRTSPNAKLDVNGDIMLLNKVGFYTYDAFDVSGNSVAHYGMSSVSGSGYRNVALSGYFGLNFYTNGTERIRIIRSGNVGIGTSTPDSKLTVKGNIHTNEVKVDLLGAVAPDYVFYKDYNLRTLAEVENYITQKGHLPNIPSAEQMEEEGIKLKEMNLKLLEKIEELTLYTINQEKRIEALESKNVNLEKENSELQSLSKRLADIEKLLNNKKQ